MMIALRCSSRLCNARSIQSTSSCYQSTKAKRAAQAERVARYSAEFPDKLLHKKQKLATHMYVANTQIADEINAHLQPHLQHTKCDTVLEINPGPGHFTRHLLDRESQFRRLILIEQMEHFMPRLQELHALYPDRVKVRQGDFIGIWKLAFMDKMDSGTRLSELLSDVPQRAFNEDVNMLVFGAVGSYPFFKHLINSLIFQTSIFNLGRCEMILALPPPIFTHLSCSNEIGYLIYRSASVLFQILFEHQFIALVPRESFLPAQADHNVSKGSKLGKVKSINPEYLYLVKFVPRRNLHEICPIQDLPALWFFIKQNFVSRRNRIIPNLEKWVPGCGPRLIINQSASELVSPLYANESVEQLPPYTTRSTTMQSRDYYPGINIYTQFGDLSPSQVLTLFREFRQWSEYGESSFLASLENTLLKLETANDEQSLDDSVNLVEDDDISSESVDELLIEAADELQAKPTKSRRKTKPNV
ncbi:dimethyladenosine transferase 2, mitochondrial [Drosophila grimshawi]|uniref:rRNA adenine N(6)-methyltransferase n=1 Tax=Drosophila grimshawi TaxID=7222 RepID=B4JSL0_DROGR|nr:dimethyladenosine transferase 2, mitochondrial [Drosophila grimshawi]EDV94750.1 GH22567 [Drosophila grimshawi]